VNVDDCAMPCTCANKLALVLISIEPMYNWRLLIAAVVAGVSTTARMLFTAL
jgi:hypothetical protein